MSLVESEYNCIPKNTMLQEEDSESTLSSGGLANPNWLNLDTFNPKMRGWEWGTINCSYYSRVSYMRGLEVRGGKNGTAVELPERDSRNLCCLDNKLVWGRRACNFLLAPKPPRCWEAGFPRKLLVNSCYWSHHFWETRESQWLLQWQLFSDLLNKWGDRWLFTAAGLCGS